MPLVQSLAHALAPWQSLFADSRLVSTSVTGVHLVALLFSGGLAVGADRATLRALRAAPDARAALLDELGAVHRPVLVALAVLFASGALLAASDVETFLESPVFWAKLALIALLLANGVVMTRTEASLRRAAAAGGATAPRLWGRLRASAWRSLLLWAATTVAGAALVGAA